jgi:hypothetical protein
MGNCWSFVIVMVLLAGQSAASRETWSPAYSDDQLGLISRVLQKSKSEVSYPAVKDMFRGRAYRPDWNSLKEDATAWEVAPDWFKDEREACRAGGVCDFIKGAESKTCLLKFVVGQGAWVFVYDREATGRFVKTGVITPPTWYGLARVALVDVFRTGKSKFILIEHQGDSGTGTDEKIHWLLGWHEGAFRTVLRETVFSMVSCLGEDTIYRMNYRIARGSKPRVEVTCSFDRVFDTAYPYDFHAQWKDWLFWDEERFSFYSKRIEDEKLDLSSDSDARFNLRFEVEQSRRRVMNLPPLPQQMWEYEAVTKYWKGIGYKTKGETD